MALAIGHGVRSPIAIALSLVVGLAACDLGEVEGGDSEVIYAADSGWEDEFVGVVDAEVQRLSTYASTDDDNWGACVRTWTVGGAAVGELASKTCVVVGVATVKTGVGGVAAAVCAGADWVQADAVLGAAAGYVSGYLSCSASATFDRFLGNFRLFNVGASEEPAETEDDWNTPECQAQYDDYKSTCGQPSSCRDQTLSCEELIARHDNNISCAEKRNDHMYECPHPDDYDWTGHQQAVSDAYQAAQRCQTSLCDSACIDTLPEAAYADYQRICL